VVQILGSTSLLFQPEGDIEASHDGVRHADQDLASRQFGAFLSDAVAIKADIAVTPEYSMPWKTLEEQLLAGVVPQPGSIWVLGCESIKLHELEALQARIFPAVTMLFESVDNNPERFLNPVAYIFSTETSTESHPPQLVMLLQFKTCPMGDADHFEINGMQAGTRLYYFGNATTQLRLATLICSDAFAFLDEHARQLYDRTLLLHIQLNAKPRQEQFRQYRNRLWSFGGDQTELLCLNWAKDVHMRCGDSRQCWRNISGSAWYLNPNKFDDSDETLIQSHRRGFYYTWLNSLRCHALFLNYGPAVYQFTATKVAHLGVTASLSRRRGPQLTETRTWDVESSRWISQNSIDDGFSAISGECGGAELNILALAASNPFSVERVLALCAGKIETGPDWHVLKNLDSCSIDASEVVRRLTACQDSEANQFRVARLRRCRRLHTILQSSLPPALSDLEHGFELSWDPASPHQNVVSSDGQRATVIYLGDSCSEKLVEQVFALAADFLGRGFSEPNDIIEARQRLHVWYRSDNGNDVTVNPYAYIDYDDPRSDSPFDIARSR
jgi:hypothetical protein